MLVLCLPLFAGASSAPQLRTTAEQYWCSVQPRLNCARLQLLPGLQPTVEPQQCGAGVSRRHSHKQRPAVMMYICSMSPMWSPPRGSPNWSAFIWRLELMGVARQMIH
ncbi:hypothetical protein B0H19DRAFT_114647 [Mycena capillaripes]|nr:hypothetical protein B0H19DRAFT_114647 [Mycena capillaripes]